MLITQALNLFTKLKRDKDQALAMMNLGVLYANENRFHEALWYYNSALIIYAKIADPLGGHVLISL